jgi:hypothetical protein
MKPETYYFFWGPKFSQVFYFTNSGQIANLNSLKTSTLIHYPLHFYSKNTEFNQRVERQTNLPTFNAAKISRFM